MPAPERPRAASSAEARQPGGGLGPLDPATAARHRWLDALRGFALLWMIGYHAAFDLNLFGLLQPRQAFDRDPLWIVQRSLILSLFLFCAGVGQALAWRAGQPAARFWRRWVQVLGCALAVTAVTIWMFPRSWVSFGVLHAMVLMLPLARWASPHLWRHAGLLAAASLALLLGWWWGDPAGHAFFDTRWTNWVGLVTRRPQTEDFVPLLPWVGSLGLGLAAGLRLPATAAPLDARMPAALVRLGRWPLTVYMLHQPILMGLLMAARRAGLL